MFKSLVSYSARLYVFEFTGPLLLIYFACFAILSLSLVIAARFPTFPRVLGFILFIMESYSIELVSFGGEIFIKDMDSGMLIFW